MKRDADKTEVMEIVRQGGYARVRPAVSKGKNYFVADYRVNGKRKLIWRSTLEEAKAEATDALDKVAKGNAVVLDLSATDRHIYVRANEARGSIQKPIDDIVRDYVEAVKLLPPTISLIEVCRDWVKRYDVQLPKITVPAAVSEIITGLEKENKSTAYVRVFSIQLNNVAKNFNCPVDTITPGLISKYLTGLTLGERTKRNLRDAVGFLNRWLILHRYLAKGTDWLEGVQNYSMRKQGEITIYTPEEMGKILVQAKKENGWRLPMVAISAFSAMRHSEICRLDWSQIEISDKPGESFIEVKAIANTKSDQRRRLVPISDNLKAWLKPYVKIAGPVCPVTYGESVKYLPDLVKRAGVPFKRNAFRHSGISYRVAQTGDIARVADDSGNSVAIIRSNYLRRVKPAEAEKWFALMPEEPEKKTDKTNKKQKVKT